MENQKSPLLIYREKRAEVHTTEEIKVAFENSFAMCFSFNENRHPTSKLSLFINVCKVNPDVMIQEVDFCVFRRESEAMRNQYLIINKNGTDEMSNHIIQLIADSGAVSSTYCFFSNKKAGIKRGYKIVFGGSPVSPVFKGNLLIDGNKILLTARYLEKADRELIKNHTPNTTGVKEL